jgi:hypothetical protein
MEMKIIDGFVWFVVTDKAKQIWDADLFELFIVFNDGSEASVYGYGIDKALEMVQREGVEIAIEGGYINN